MGRTALGSGSTLSTSGMPRLENLESSRVPLGSISIPLPKYCLAGGRVMSEAREGRAWLAGRRASVDDKSKGPLTQLTVDYKVAEVINYAVHTVSDNNRKHF